MEEKEIENRSYSPHNTPAKFTFFQVVLLWETWTKGPFTPSLSTGKALASSVLMDSEGFCYCF